MSTPLARTAPRRIRALLAVALLLPVGAQGSEPEPPVRVEFEIRASDSLPPIEDLIREGLDYSAHGNLVGASKVWSEIRDLYPDHPAGPIFEIHTLEARKSLDFQDEQYDEALNAKAREAAKLSKAWLKRAPDDPQALFYSGQAKFEQMFMAAIEGRYYRAGKVGEQAREHLERALELDSSLVDAKLPLGTYYYYVSIATRFIRWFSWLWFVPTGEHDLALAYVEEVSREGDLFRYGASVQLAQFYLYFEDDPERAAPIIARLHAAYPENSYLAFEELEVRFLQDDYQGALEKALEIELSQGSQFGDEIRRRMAKIWRARAELFLGNPDRVGEILSDFDESWETLGPWGRRWLLLTRGNLEDVRGERAEAVAYYERVIELKSRWESGRAVELARAGLEEPFRIEAARLSAR